MPKSRLLNRHELRAAAEAAESLKEQDQAEQGRAEQPSPKKAEKKPRSRAKAVAKAPIRMRIIWGVFNASNHQVGRFEYPEREKADEMAAQLTATKKDTHFVRVIKEPVVE